MYTCHADDKRFIQFPDCVLVPQAHLSFLYTNILCRSSFSISSLLIYLLYVSSIHYFKIFRLSHLLMCITNVERQEASRKLNQTNTKKEFHVEEIKTPNKRSRKRKKLPSISSSPPTRFLWPMECASTATVDRICVFNLLLFSLHAFLRGRGMCSFWFRSL